MVNKGEYIFSHIKLRELLAGKNAFAHNHLWTPIQIPRIVSLVCRNWTPSHYCSFFIHYSVWLVHVWPSDLHPYIFTVCNICRIGISRYSAALMIDIYVKFATSATICLIALLWAFVYFDIDIVLAISCQLLSDFVKRRTYFHCTSNLCQTFCTQKIIQLHWVTQILTFHVGYHRPK